MNVKQKRFADEYLACLDASKAAVAAGYSKATAGQIGYQLLHRTSIKAYIDGIADNVAKKLGITADYVLGATKDICDATKSSKPGVALKAIDYMGKHLKLWDNDDKKLQQNITINILDF